MSPWADRRAAASEDEGFSLVEVMVAMLIFAIIAVSSLSFITSALTATARSRTETTAKNLGQERLEAMRNLPYSVSASVSAAVPDLLDTYYTSTATAAASTAGTGYVSPTTARDTRNGDPATGAFFRRVFSDAEVAGFPGFTQRVTAQFMKSETQVLPPSTFVSTSTGLDGLPPAQTVSVSVTTLWQTGGRPQRFTIRSQISEGAAKPPQVTLQGRVAMLRFSGILPGARELVSEAGVVNLDGSVTNSTSASLSSQGGFAAIANGTRLDGAKDALTAPPDSARTDVPAGVLTLDDGGAPVSRLSTSLVSGTSVGATNGMPRAGTSSVPVSASLMGGGFGGSDLVFAAGNAPDLTSRLALTGDFARVNVPACSGSCAAVQGQGRLTTTNGATHAATASLGGLAGGTLAVLPTATSPDGLLRVTLTSFSTTCDSRATTSPRASANLQYAGTVSHRTFNGTAYGYSAPIAISSSSTTDPLAGIDLATTVVGVDGLGAPLYLGDYVQSWSSLTAPTIGAATELAGGGTSVSLQVPGVFTVTSRPLRTEQESTAGLQLATVSCVAGDVRP